MRSAPTVKIFFRFQVLGTGEEMTRSLESAIMAPSLNTASMTIRMVGKYLPEQRANQLNVAEHLAI